MLRHQRRVRQRPGAVLDVEPRQAEGAHRARNLEGDRFRRADAERAVGAGFALELGPGGGRPAASPPMRLIIVS